MTKKWSEKSYNDYSNQVDSLLLKRKQRETNQQEWNQIALAQDEGETPIEFVKWLIQQRKLDNQKPLIYDNKIGDRPTLVHKDFKIVVRMGETEMYIGKPHHGAQLYRNSVKDLIPFLQSFVKTGSFPVKNEKQRNSSDYYLKIKTFYENGMISLEIEDLTVNITNGINSSRPIMTIEIGLINHLVELTQKDVSMIIPHLQSFAKTGLL